MSELQTTISEKTELAGTNLFTGEQNKVRFYPGEPNTGLVFIVNGERINAILANAKRKRRNFISSIFLSNPDGQNSIGLVEHLLSPVYALGIDNLQIELTDGVCPTFDDIALTYYSLLKKFLKTQDVPKEFFTINPDKIYTGFSTDPKGISGRIAKRFGLEIETLTKKDRLIVQPSDDEFFSVKYDANYPYLSVGEQTLTFRFGVDDYANEIAKARTFCFPGYKIIHDLIIELGQNYWHGVTDSNCAFVVHDANNYANAVEPCGRGTFGKSEFVRHKMLDWYGTMALTGKHFKRTRFGPTQTGHKFDLEELSKLCDEDNKYLIKLS